MGSGWYHPIESALYNFDDRIIPHYQRITDALHRHGAKIFAQFTHVDMLTPGDISMYPVWAPSAVPYGAEVEEIPKEMEIEEIKEPVQAFGQAARISGDQVTACSLLSDEEKTIEG